MTKNPQDPSNDDGLFAVIPTRKIPEHAAHEGQEGNVPLTKSSDEKTAEDYSQSEFMSFKKDITKWMKGTVIGTGSYSQAKTYLAMDSTSGELIAVKEFIFKIDESKSGQNVKPGITIGLVRHVVQIAQSLDHPKILQYLGHQMIDSTFSIVTEYLPGGTLGDCLRQYGRFQEAMVSNFTRQILEGLAYLHKEGVVHRDIRADKIYLDNVGTCKIGWNLMMEKIDQPYGQEREMTHLWSTYWQAPEVIRSEGREYTGKSDIWSLGCPVLELVSGQRPFSQEEVIGTIYKLGTLSMPPPIPDDMIGVLGAKTVAFLEDCWTTDVKERPEAKMLLLSPFCYVEES